MADKYYAWSTFSGTRDSQTGKLSKGFNPGDEVSADALGVDKEEFQLMIEGGSVRKQQYPEMPETYTGSPIEFLREQAALAATAAEMQANYESNTATGTWADVVEAETGEPPAEVPEPGDVKTAKGGVS